MKDRVFALHPALLPVLLLSLLGPLAPATAAAVAAAPAATAAPPAADPFAGLQAYPIKGYLTATIHYAPQLTSPVIAKRLTQGRGDDRPPRRRRR